MKLEELERDKEKLAKVRARLREPGHLLSDDEEKILKELVEKYFRARVRTKNKKVNQFKKELLWVTSIAVTEYAFFRIVEDHIGKGKFEEAMHELESGERMFKERMSEGALFNELAVIVIRIHKAKIHHWMGNHILSEAQKIAQKYNFDYLQSEIEYSMR